MKQWNLKTIFKDFSVWQVELEQVKGLLPEYQGYQGKLQEKETFQKFMRFDIEMEQRLTNLYVYAYMNYDLNQKNNETQGYYGQVYQLYMDYSAAVSFVTSEIIAIGEETINAWVSEDTELQKSAFSFQKIFLNQKNVLDSKSELIMANYGGALGNYNRLYDQLAVADNESVTVTLTDGSTLVVNESNFRGYLENLPLQEDRRIVFEAVFKFYDKHKNTFAGIYNGIIQTTFATMKNRNYENFLEVFLKSNQIPTSVYLTLVETCRENTQAVKKYYQLLKKHFRLETIHTYDRFLSFAKTNEVFTYERSKEIFFESVKKIGGKFEEYAHRVLEEGRVDVDIRDGKRTGAYSTGYYKDGPYILLNHDNRLDDAFTLVHEAGHSMHTLFSNENQPYQTSNYKIFVAEIASTFNEQLFLDYLLETTDDKDLKLVLLQSAIDGILSTFYRQTLFATYEYEANKLLADGKTITAEALSDIMKELYKTYYDIDLKEEPYKENVWGYIPHFFHSPFYVYQYATSYAASAAIYQQVKEKEPKALERYIELLKAGDSKFPIDIVKDAGVDLTTKEPFLSVVTRLTELVDQLEKELEVA